MSYYACITGPAGHTTYLVRGRETPNREAATRYAHPSAAERALTRYEPKIAGQRYAAYVLDEDEGM